MPSDGGGDWGPPPIKRQQKGALSAPALPRQTSKARGFFAPGPGPAGPAPLPGFWGGGQGGGPPPCPSPQIPCYLPGLALPGPGAKNALAILVFLRQARVKRVLVCWPLYGGGGAPAPPPIPRQPCGIFPALMPDSRENLYPPPWPKGQPPPTPKTRPLYQSDAPHEMQWEDLGGRRFI